MAGIEVIRNRRGFAESSQLATIQRYSPLICALVLFRRASQEAVQQLKHLADELTFQVDRNAMEKKRTGSRLAAAGGGVATVGGILALATVTPLIPFFLLGGGVTSVVGGIISSAADWEAKQKRQEAGEEVNRIFVQLEAKLTAVRTEIQNLVGTKVDNAKELDELMYQLRVDIASLPAANAMYLPQMRDLEKTLSNMRTAYSQVPQQLWEKTKNFLFTAWYIVPCMAGLMIEECATVTADACTHAWASACDQDKSRHLDCYGRLGKGLFILSVVGNMASTVWSAQAAQEMTEKLRRLEAAENVADKERAYKDLAKHLHDQASDLEIKQKFIFGAGLLGK